MKAQAVSDCSLIAPVPRISLQAFCEAEETARIIEAAATDRRMERAHVSAQMGGPAAAIAAFREAPTPNIIVLDTAANGPELLSHLAALAEFCDPGTKVVVIGRYNDILLYRELLARGVSDYLVAPSNVLEFIRTISHLYITSGAAPLGKIIAITGAKGGTGASTLAHNIAYSAARDLSIQTVLADMDLGFGTAGLDYNQDPPQGIADAVFAPDRIDETFVDRLLAKCSEKLSMLAAPGSLDRLYDFAETGFDHLADILRATTPCVILDVPLGWTAWKKRMLVNADEAVIVAVPDLASLRNAKNLLEALRAARAHDVAPRLVMNVVGIPKRPEINVSEFAKAVGVAPSAIIAFEPKLFGIAANNGQMLAEIEATAKPAIAIRELTRKLVGCPEISRGKRSFLVPFITKFVRKKAS
ncbi:MAG: CtpF protein [Methylocapsa sp.]|nr:CtpF protein [Methylocapsa sp.]